MHRHHRFWGLVLSGIVVGCGSHEPQPSSAVGGAGGAGGTGDAAGAGGTGGASGTSGTGGGATETRFDPLIAAIERERIELGAPGVAVAVIEEGEVTFARGFGSKDLVEDVPVLPTTLFRIGSVTKMLTTTAVLEQVAQGHVDLAAPVTEYVPELHVSADATWAASLQVHHLLTHTSAMSDYLTIDAPAAEREDAGLETFLTGRFADVDYLMAPPGAFCNYSNPNFYVAGLIAEKTAGKPYRQLMKEDVFEPLGMDRTFFLASEAVADGDYALGKTTFPNMPNPVRPDTYDNAWARPAGYATSSVLDLAKFVAFLADGHDDVLPRALSDDMQSPQVDTQEFLDLVHYGYGLQVMDGVFLGGADAFYRIRRSRSSRANGARACSPRSAGRRRPRPSGSRGLRAIELRQSARAATRRAPRPSPDALDPARKSCAPPLPLWRCAAARRQLVIAGAARRRCRGSTRLVDLATRLFVGRDLAARLAISAAPR